MVSGLVRPLVDFPDEFLHVAHVPDHFRAGLERTRAEHETGRIANRNGDHRRRGLHALDGMALAILEHGEGNAGALGILLVHSLFRIRRLKGPGAFRRPRLMKLLQVSAEYLFGLLPAQPQLIESGSLLLENRGLPAARKEARISAKEKPPGPQHIDSAAEHGAKIERLIRHPVIGT